MHKKHTIVIIEIIHITSFVFSPDFLTGLYRVTSSGTQVKVALVGLGVNSAQTAVTVNIYHGSSDQRAKTSDPIILQDSSVYCLLTRASRATRRPAYFRGGIPL